MDEPVVVYATDSLSDGYLAKGRLESEGIPVMTKGELEGPYRAGTLELLVPASLATQARAILAGVAELDATMFEEPVLEEPPGGGGAD